MTVEQRIRTGLRENAEHRPTDLPPVEDILARARRPNLAIGVAIVVLVVAASALVITLAVRTPPDARPRQADTTPALDVELLEQHSWHAPSPEPAGAAAAAVQVWTGEEVLLWGGPGSSAGAAYDPATRAWRWLPESPLPAIESQVAVWTGEEMIVWGGRDAPAYGRIYDPASDAWRVTAPAPVAATESPVAVWTSEEMIVWGGTIGGGYIPSQVRGAAYDPATDTWRELSPAPLRGRSYATAVWTGDRMIVWGGQNEDNTPVPDGAAYDPVTDSWRRLSPAPVTGFYRHSAVWTGDEMLVWGWVHGTTGQRNETAVYDPAADRWRSLSPAPLDPPPPNEAVGGQSAIWAGSVMLAWSGTLDDGGPLALAFDPTADRWTRLSQAPTPMWQHPNLSWTGSSLIVSESADEAAAVAEDTARAAEDTAPAVAELRFGG